MPAQAIVQIFKAALAAADPYQAVLQALHLNGNSLEIAATNYELADYKRIIVIGAGKATARMALALEKMLGKRITDGLIIVKTGHSLPLKIIAQAEATHPVPDQSGVAATRRILELLQFADEKTLVICLLSGGASALLIAPVAGVTLQDTQEVTSLLMHDGASISELNSVRKHLSLVKGGLLAEMAAPAQMLTLIISDVVGDSLEVIASGPTAPDSSTFAQAWEVIKKYQLREKIPLRVMAYLKSGMAGDQPETVKTGLNHVRNVIIASNAQALTAAHDQALQLGYTASVLSNKIQGDASEFAHFLAQTARATLAEMQAGEQRCFLSGGETTVKVSGSGKGGRNQELALAFALEAEGLTGVTLLSAGTDGTDGPTDAAGAMVDERTAERARQLGLVPEQYLAANDSYTFFKKFDAGSGSNAHIITGPTATNVMDIQIMLLKK